MHCKSRLVCLWLLCVLPCIGSAIQNQPPRKDPQSSFEPRSAPGKGQQFLVRMEGQWDVEKTFHPRSGSPVRLKGTASQKMIHEGRFLQSDFSFESEGQVTTGTGLIGYEAEKDQFTSCWLDSRSTRFSFRKSQPPFNGVEIILFSENLGEATKPRTRTVTKFDQNDQRLVHRQYAINADGSERLMMELIMNRAQKSK